ncbi:MAG: hemoglobin [Patiriisocius sp.]
MGGSSTRKSLCFKIFYFYTRNAVIRKKDIFSRKDIKHIISSFYEFLLLDEKMWPVFEDIIARNHLEEGLEIMTDFWNDILFENTTYTNNTLQKHLNKNAFVKFKVEHFTIWTSYFF